LEKAVETGKALERDREAAIVALKKDLDDINAKHERDIELSRKDFDARRASGVVRKPGWTRRSSVRPGSSPRRIGISTT